MKLFSIGYGNGHKWTVEALLKLCQAQQAIVIDTRFKPVARWVPAWSRKNLEAELGPRYRWMGDTLGNVNYKGEGGIQIADLDAGLAELATCIQRGQSLVLLCVCSDHRKCHRTQVLQEVKARFGIEAEVLHHPSAPSPSKNTPVQLSLF